jgi:hypothetical protein
MRTFMVLGYCGVDGGVSFGFGFLEECWMIPRRPRHSGLGAKLRLLLPCHADLICIINYFPHFILSCLLL